MEASGMMQDHNTPSEEETLSLARYHKQQMKPWESLVDKKIREAMKAGEFDNLKGSGQPIDLSENPFEDPDWRTAHRLLRNADFAAAWIEERKDIDAGLEAARIVLARAWTVLLNARETRDEEPATARWARAQA